MESKIRTQVLVALIGVVGAIGVAVLSNWDKIFPPEPPEEFTVLDEQGGEGDTAGSTDPSQDFNPPRTPPQPSTSDLSSVSAWPLLGEETFTSSTGPWRTGSWSKEPYYSHFDVGITGGKYRWDIGFMQKRHLWIDSPYSSAVNFYLAVDVKISEFEPGRSISPSLMFGMTRSEYYRFATSSNGKFLLSRYDGSEHHNLIDWTPIPIKIKFNPKEMTQLAILADDLSFKFYVDSTLVGEIREPAFRGGKVALSVQAWDRTSVVVDFDNFEFRRKP